MEYNNNLNVNEGLLQEQKKDKSTDVDVTNNISEERMAKTDDKAKKERGEVHNIL